jgi:hypothetical protein
MKDTWTSEYEVRGQITKRNVAGGWEVSPTKNAVKTSSLLWSGPHGFGRKTEPREIPVTRSAWLHSIVDRLRKAKVGSGAGGIESKVNGKGRKGQRQKLAQEARREGVEGARRPGEAQWRTSGEQIRIVWRGHAILYFAIIVVLFAYVNIDKCGVRDYLLVLDTGAFSPFITYL